MAFVWSLPWSREGQSCPGRPLHDRPSSGLFRIPRQENAVSSPSYATQGTPASGSEWGSMRSKTPSVLSPGVVRQVRPIVGPFHAVLKLEMNYVVGGVVSHRNVVNVHIFVSEYWF